MVDCGGIHGSLNHITELLNLACFLGRGKVNKLQAVTKWVMLSSPSVLENIIIYK